MDKESILRPVRLLVRILPPGMQNGDGSADASIGMAVQTGSGLSGRLGGRVYRQVGGTTVVSAAPAGVDARSPAQLAARARLELAGRLWAELPLDAMERWRAYARSLPPASSGGERGSRKAGGYAVFRGLAAKYLQVNGGNAVPTEPPAGAFLGDGAAVTASGSAASDGASGVVFESSHPNTPGVATELLLQRLPARHRLPKARDYRTRRFVSFAGAPVLVPCEPGAYACAIRFVRVASGQATAIVPLGTVVAGSVDSGL